MREGRTRRRKWQPGRSKGTAASPGPPLRSRKEHKQDLSEVICLGEEGGREGGGVGGREGEEWEGEGAVWTLAGLSLQAGSSCRAGALQSEASRSSLGCGPAGRQGDEKPASLPGPDPPPAIFLGSCGVGVGGGRVRVPERTFVI